MADAGLFIGWGEPVTGREAKGLEVLGEALAYYGKAEQEGRIESHETVLLYPPTVVSCRASSWSAEARRRSPRCARRTSSSGSLRGPRSSCRTLALSTPRSATDCNPRSASTRLR